MPLMHVQCIINVWGRAEIFPNPTCFASIDIAVSLVQKSDISNGFLLGRGEQLQEMLLLLLSV